MILSGIENSKCKGPEVGYSISLGKHWFKINIEQHMMSEQKDIPLEPPSM